MTAELLRNVRGKSCSRKDSVGAQHTQSLLILLLAGRICNCCVPKNAQTGHLTDVGLSSRESPEQFGNHSENNGRGRVEVSDV